MGSKANRTDLLLHSPATKQAGQPNGRPLKALVPTQLPYGQHQQLDQQIEAQPKQRAPGPPQPPPPTSTDHMQPAAFAQVLQKVQQGKANRPAPTPMFAPTERPDEPITAGSIGQPDSVLGAPQPQNISSLLRQVAMLTGSAALADLATRAQAAGS